MTGPGVSRRGFLGASLALGAGIVFDPVLRTVPTLSSLPGLAPARTAAGALTDIDHVVLMMQENRSFDHYFGSLRGVAGFGDKNNRSAFEQINGKGKSVFPFHIDPKKTGGGCTTDPDHTWYGQHTGVADGKMDGWLSSVRATFAPAAMGYVDGNDIPYHYALAEEFTVCDHYFCSAQGATDPNRSYYMSGTIDPAGLAGGPIISAEEGLAPYSWTTMPERLEALGISWQIYSSPDSTNEDGDNTVIYFEQYHSNPTLNAKALVPTYDDFLRDAAAGNLPQVSWVISPVGILEHPLQSTPQHGQLSFAKVFNAVTANTEAWKKTALIITYDENGGFFDHVPPPMPEPGTPDEFLTAVPLTDDADGVTGPIGLGPRVPTMIVSPFSRGGFVSSDVFDHTSALRFLEARFGVEAPNISAWRRDTTGDLTSAFNFAKVDASIPDMPKPRKLEEPGKVCSPVLAKYPKTKDVPSQPRGKAKQPSGLPTAQPVLLSLDFLYTPTDDIDAAIEQHVDALGAQLEWKVRAMETVVACLRVSETGPRILLTEHLDGTEPILVYRVERYDDAVARLRAAGITEIRELGIPHGPCASFHTDNGQHLAVYELTNPGAPAHFDGRFDP